MKNAISRKMKVFAAVIVMVFFVSTAYAGQLKVYLEDTWGVEIDDTTGVVLDILEEQLIDQSKAMPTYRITEDHPAFVLEKIRTSLRDLDLDGLLGVFDVHALRSQVPEVVLFQAWEDGTEIQQVLSIIFGSFDKGEVLDFLAEGIIDSVMPFIALFAFDSDVDFPQFSYMIHDVESDGNHANVYASLFFSKNGAMTDYSLPPFRFAVERQASTWKIISIEQAEKNHLAAESEFIGTWESEYVIMSAPALGDIKLTKEEGETLGFGFDISITLEQNGKYNMIWERDASQTSEEGTWEYVNGYVKLSPDFHLLRHGKEMKITVGSSTIYFKNREIDANNSIYSRFVFDDTFEYIINKNGEAMITAYIGKQNGKVVIPSIIDGSLVTRIGPNAFKESTVESVVVPEGVNSIGASAFESSKLHSISLPNSLNSIESNAFAECLSLSHITIPFNVSLIHADTFSHCVNLKTITILSGETAIESSALDSQNLNRIYGLPGSRASEYAKENQIAYTGFLDGTEWKQPSSSDSIFFDAGKIRDLLHLEYSITDNKIKLWSLQELIRSSGTISGNVLKIKNIEEPFICINSSNPTIDIPSFPIWDEDHSLIGTRWKSRAEEPYFLQLAENGNIEILNTKNELVFWYPYYSDGYQMAIDEINSNVFTVHMSTLINSKGDYVVEMYDYVGEAIEAIIPTLTPTPTETPKPTATPQPTAQPTEVPFTEEYLIGSWNNGKLIFYEDRTATYQGYSGYYRVSSDSVSFEIDRGKYGDELDIQERFYYMPDGSLRNWRDEVFTKDE